jgi:GGDEF domain-containing protein
VYYIMALSLLLNVGLVYLARFLAFDPGFGIKTRAAGELALWLTWGQRWVIYGDIDKLTVANWVMTTNDHTGHDRFNEIARWAISHLRESDTALVFGGDEWRFLVSPPRSGSPQRWHADRFCERLQALLRSAPYTDWEREQLLKATGYPYVRITLASAYSRGVWTHRAALNAAKVRVQLAKPKDGQGQRGEILEATV